MSLRDDVRSGPVLVALALALVARAGPIATAREDSCRVPTQPADRKEQLRREAYRLKVERRKDHIRTVLKDSTAPVHAKVSGIYSAYDSRVRDLLPTLEQMAKEDPSPQVRRAASTVLEKWKKGDQKAARKKAEAAARAEKARRLAAMTPEERWRAQENAQDARIKKHIDENRQKILHDLEHGGPKERERAAFWVEYRPQYFREAMPMLRKIVMDEREAAIRIRAARALIKCDGKNALPALRTCLAPENDPGLRSMAARQLARLGDKRAMPVLIELLRSDREITHILITQCLREVTGLDLGFRGGISGFRPISNEVKEARKRAIRAWQQWWKENESTFVFPPRTTQPSSRSSRRR